MWSYVAVNLHKAMIISEHRRWENFEIRASFSVCGVAVVFAPVSPHPELTVQRLRFAGRLGPQHVYALCGKPIRESPLLSDLTDGHKNIVNLGYLHSISIRFRVPQTTQEAPSDRDKLVVQ